MSPPSNIIRQLLIDSNLGTGLGLWPIYVGFFPERPDEALCVYDTAGRLDGRIMATGEQIEHPGIMVMVRGRDYPTAWSKANSISLLLDEVKRFSVAITPTDRYTLHNVSRTGAIMPLGVEVEGDRRRHLFTINSVLTLARISDTESITTQDGDRVVTQQDESFLIIH